MTQTTSPYRWLVSSPVDGEHSRTLPLLERDRVEVGVLQAVVAGESGGEPGGFEVRIVSVRERDPLGEAELATLAVVGAEADSQARSYLAGGDTATATRSVIGAVPSNGLAGSELVEEVAGSAVLRAEAGVVAVDVGRAVVEDAEALERPGAERGTSDEVRCADATAERAGRAVESHAGGVAAGRSVRRPCHPGRLPQRTGLCPRACAGSDRKTLFR